MNNYIQYTTIDKNIIIEKINYFLKEDLPDGDITTNATIQNNRIIKADIIAVENLIFAGKEIIPHCFNADINIYANDGEELTKNSTIATITGDAKSILSRERVILNILQRLCGIATNTKRYVDLAKPFNVKILDTRKTTPGMRIFEKYAVKCGGGYNHRFDLSSGILIKDNHIQSAGSITKALTKIDRKNWIELEVDTFEQIYEGIDNNVDGFLLDNMIPNKIKEAVNIIRFHESGKKLFIEASGGINLKNITPYLDTGVDAISIGALTHQIRSSDIKLEVK